jgi:RNA polymerase sigma-B factor
MTILSRTTDQELARAYRVSGDAEAREALILRHNGLVRSIARRYSRRGLPYEDIVQAGYIGLIQAVDRFDPERGVPLHAYAARMIAGEIMHHFRDRGWSVRVPRPLQELGRRLVTVNEQLGHQLGRSPTLVELASAVDAPVDQVAEAMMVRRAFFAEPLAEPAAGSDEAQTGEPLGGDDPGFDGVDNRQALAAAIRCLPPRERTIVGLRFFEGLSQAEIAGRMGISQMHVSRLLRASLEDLRERLERAEAQAA